MANPCIRYLGLLTVRIRVGTDLVLVSKLKDRVVPCCIR